MPKTKKRPDLIQLATIAVVGLLVLGGLWVLEIDIDKIASVPLGRWALIAAAIAGFLGTVGNAFRDHILGERSPAPKPDASSTEGSASVRALIAIPICAAIAIVVLSGCGAFALGGHRRAATYADLVARVVSAEVAEACPADAGTMSDACAVAIPAADSLPALVTAYREGVKLAASVEDGSDVLGPLCALARPVLDVVDLVLGALGMPPELDAVLAFIRSLLASSGPAS